jgi:hypothetical protein
MTAIVRRCRRTLGALACSLCVLSTLHTTAASQSIDTNRLANHKELPQRIEIARAGRNVSITMGEYAAVAPFDGQERELVGPNGRDSKLSYRMTEDAILQFSVFEQAKRKSTYRLNESGQLVMSVYMTSEKLASPIQYDLVYERQAR